LSYIQDEDPVDLSISMTFSALIVLLNSDKKRERFAVTQLPISPIERCASRIYNKNRRNQK